MGWSLAGYYYYYYITRLACLPGPILLHSSFTLKSLNNYQFERRTTEKIFPSIYYTIAALVMKANFGTMQLAKRSRQTAASLVLA